MGDALCRYEDLIEILSDSGGLKGWSRQGGGGGGGAPWGVSIVLRGHFGLEGHGRSMWFYMKKVVHYTDAFRRQSVSEGGGGSLYKLVQRYIILYRALGFLTSGGSLIVLPRGKIFQKVDCCFVCSKLYCSVIVSSGLI